MPIPVANDHLDELRTLAVTDPRQARIYFCALLDNNPNSKTGHIEDLLHHLKAPGEGRLRQIIANAVRTRDDKAQIVSHLQQWLETETDEFARRAIEAALAGTPKVKERKRDDGPHPIVDAYLVEAYRYASNRINHRIRNALLEPATSALKLKRVIRSVQDEAKQSELLGIIDDLTGALERVGRIVESDVEDDHFRWKEVPLCEWIEIMTAEYGRNYKSLTLSMDNHPATIYANAHLLTTIFWNLWINAQQAVEGHCRIQIHIEVVGACTMLLICDNGDGFPSDLADVAFQARHSTHGVSRGRGLLEVQDAVEQLKGSVQLIEYHGAHRLKITLPLSTNQRNS